MAHSGEDSGEELGRRLAGERRVGAARSRRWRRQGCSSDERRRSVAAERGQLGRTAERRGGLGEGQQEGGETVGEHGGDTWSGAGAGGSLGQRGTTACGGAAAR
jgi:hypothetical protein